MSKYVIVPINKIKVSDADRDRPLDIEHANMLAEDIAVHGLRMPLSITSDYWLIAGRHRLEACRVLGHKGIAVIIRNYAMADNPERFERDMVSENLHHKALTPEELAKSIERYKKAGKNNVEIAHIIGVELIVVDQITGRREHNRRNRRNYKAELQSALDKLEELHRYSELNLPFNCLSALSRMYTKYEVDDCAIMLDIKAFVDWRSRELEAARLIR